MIDLTQSLPSAILGANGELIFLNTDYRLWIRFYKEIEQDDIERDISYLFKNTPPVIDSNIYAQLKAFLYNPPVTPKFEGSSGSKVFDYILDGDYIFSALYATYGIDILEMDMHWHKFQALCDNVIGDSTLWGYAKGVRAYQKQNKDYDYDKEQQKAKTAWSFEEKLTAEEQAKIDEFNTYFGGG